MGKTGSLRNVLKRFERIRDLVGRGEWTEDSSVFGLPKTKQQRVKARKAVEKDAASAEETAPKTSAAPPANQ